ncbi:MAG: hypothetical protein ACYTGN_13800 [Planctomycetota bacterium]
MVDAGPTLAQVALPPIRAWGSGTIECPDCKLEFSVAQETAIVYQPLGEGDRLQSGIIEMTVTAGDNVMQARLDVTTDKADIVLNGVPLREVSLD